METTGVSLKKQKSKRGQHKLRKQKAREQKVNKFLEHLNEQKQQDFVIRLKNYCGKNQPTTYKPEYQFTQQWEAKEVSDNSSESSLVETFGSVYLAYSILTMTIYVMGVWTISLERYFQTKNISEVFPLYYLLIGINFSDIVLRIYQKYSQFFICFDCKQFLVHFYSNIFIICYSTAMIFFDLQHTVMNFIQVIIIYFLYSKASDIYNYLKIMEFGLQYEHFIKIGDLLLNIFIEAHLFAIVLFCASKIPSEVNWVTHIGIENETAMVKYINAIYFACTTMLTIGYGDVSPQNVNQKCVTIIIQIIGVIAFGYILNEMGHTLSKMRQQSDILQRDLQTISKISKYYNLQNKLQSKARTFILNNTRKSEEIKVEDQNKLLNKLNEDLRQEINLQNSLNVVKSSIFYLCHWSKSMQLQIAQRLQKKIFAPNEKIVSSNSKENRVYIIKKGRIDISMHRYGSNQEYRKIIKIINTSKKTHLQVTDNIYGYTAVFSNRPVRLEAIAKDFTSTYSVNKDDILFCIMQNSSDFQYYHEVKCRIDQSVFSEQWEAPAIKNIRQHYCPSHLLLIKKHKNALGLSTNSRKFAMRTHKKLRNCKLLGGYFSKYRSDSNQFGSFGQKTIQFTTNKPTVLDSIKQIDFEDFCQNDQVIVQPVQRRASELAALRLKFFNNSLDQRENKKIIASSFQISKEYRNFFCVNNLTRVLFALEKENCKERRLTGRNPLELKSNTSYFQTETY